MSEHSDNMNCDVHLHAEIELLKQALVDKQSQLIAMETACLRESDRQVELEDSIIAWQDKYDRLYESHKRVQKVNQNLEDKLLKLVDRNSNERAQLTSDVATLSVRLAQANYNIATLQREIERYKTDMGLAIQLLQCKPDSFVSQKVTSLPLEMQSKVTQYMRLDSQSHSDSEGSLSGIGVATSRSYRVLPASDSPPPMCPFPPTAMVYSMRGLDEETGLAHSAAHNGSTPTKSAHNHHHHVPPLATAATASMPGADMISPQLMARYLHDELKASELKHCDTCLCASGGRDLTVLADTAHSYSVGTQTLLHGDANNALCLRCNSNLNSPSRTNSPYIMKLVKSSDSVISETKSSYSGSLAALDMTGYMVGGGGGGGGCDTRYLAGAAAAAPMQRKDDLTVNPILGHHRLCDRKMSSAMAKQREAAAAAAAAAASVELQIENELRGLSSKQPLGKAQAATTNKLPPVQTAATVPMYGDGVHPAQQMHQQQQPMDTASGSTNSLWSKSSSSNNNHTHNGSAGGNAEGAKMFETFNRNLIKSIKSENPKIAGPRLCALRIQNGTSNILLDNIASDDVAAPTVVYTRRPRFLDEELDETKDIITSPQQRPAVAAVDHGDGSLAVVEAAPIINRTDYEKCNGTVAVGDANGSLRKDLLSGSSMSISTATNDRSPQLEPVVLCTVQHQQQQQQQQNFHHQQQHHHYTRPSTSDTAPSSSRAAPPPLKTTASNSQSTAEPDAQESAILRRQQLSRVAEWVQSNHLDCVAAGGTSTSATTSSAVSGGRKVIGADDGSPIAETTSIDSGYKTKGPHHYRTAIANNNNNQHHHSHHNGSAADFIDPASAAGQPTPASKSLSDDHKLDPRSAGPLEFAQSLCNNNNVAARGKRSAGDGCTQTTMTMSAATCEAAAPAAAVRTAQAPSVASSTADTAAAAAASPIDFAQMEYNVKQFLLKQNEWSSTNTTSATIPPQHQAVNGQTAAHRTETNL